VKLKLSLIDLAGGLALTEWLDTMPHPHTSTFYMQLVVSLANTTATSSCINNRIFTVKTKRMFVMQFFLQLATQQRCVTHIFGKWQFIYLFSFANYI
jgi:hypothetical protein